MGCLLCYYQLGTKGKEPAKKIEKILFSVFSPDPFLGASTFLVYSALQVQNESCDLEKNAVDEREVGPFHY